MRIKVLGSAAAEGWPALFCECEHCAKARQNGGKDLRSRTSYLINGSLLVDIGPDIYLHDTRYGFFTKDLEAILVTHTHEDHYNCEQFLNRCEYMSVVSKSLELAGSEKVFSCLGQRTGKKLSAMKLVKQLLVPGKTIELADMKVTALRANHQVGNDEVCLNYIVQDKKGTVLIANDTGWWNEETWEAVKDFKFDIAFIDSTIGLGRRQYRNGHMSADVVVEFYEKLKNLGCLAKDSQVFANHFSHNGGGSHNELCCFFEPHGIDVAYDGLEVII
jgi:phosphoribosyl 1,2-cyclic phosphate phosphodiesterase